MISQQDQEVIHRFLAGEATAVAKIDQWLRQATAVFHRRLGPNYDDVIQDARLEIARLLSGGRFRGGSSLKTYVWRLASNVCIDRVRRDKRFVWTDVDSGGTQTLGDPQTETARSAEQRDLAARVLASMGEECRRLWRLLFAGASYREISAQLGIAEETARARVVRCRRKALAARAALLPPHDAERSALASPPAEDARELNEDPLSSLVLEPGLSGKEESAGDLDPIVPRVIQVCNRHLMEYLKRYPGELDRVHPGTFEQIIGELFTAEGFQVEVISSWNQPDGGVDLIAVRRLTSAFPVRLAIQCKKHKRSNQVSAAPIRALAGVLDRFHAHVGVVATTSFFTEQAKEETRSFFWKIALRDYDDIVEALQRFGGYELNPAGLWVPDAPAD